MTTSGKSSILMAILVMALVIYAVPFPGSLIFVAAIVGGAAIAVWRFRSSTGGSADR